jgi:hypothetical protein
MKRRVLSLLHRVTMSLMGQQFKLRVEYDCKDPLSGRLFIQVVYDAPCSKTGHADTWKGRKWQLSEHMTDDEIVKTMYAAFEAAVKHEILEGFKVDGRVLFNPHVNFEELLLISDKEVKREEQQVLQF